MSPRRFTVTFAPRDPDDHRDYLAELRAWSVREARRSVEAGRPAVPAPTAEQARLAAEFTQAAREAARETVHADAL